MLLFVPCVNDRMADAGHKGEVGERRDFAHGGGKWGEGFVFWIEKSMQETSSPTWHLVFEFKNPTERWGDKQSNYFDSSFPIPSRTGTIALK